MRVGTSLVRRVPPVVLAALSGVLLGLGIAVILQQYGVWPLTVGTGLGLPTAVGALGAAGVWVTRRRTGDDR